MGAMSSRGATIDLPGAEIARLPEILRSKTERPLTVRLSGTAYLTEPLVLGEEASRVTLTGPVIISGGVLLDKWTDGKYNGRDAKTTKLPFVPSTLRQLFVGDVRFGRPEFPGTGFFRFAEYAAEEDRKAPWNTPQDQMIYAEDTLNPEWRNIEDVEVVVHHYWVTSRMKIKSVDPTRRYVKFDRKSIWKLNDDYDSAGRTAVFTVENVAELFWQPQTFYYDRPSGAIYTTDRIKSAIAPRLSELLRVTGAQDFKMEGLTFSHTEVDLGPDKSGDIQAGFSVPAAVTLTNCVAPQITKCRFTQLGGWGLDIAGDAARSAVISKNEFRDLGAGSVKLENNTMGSSVADNVIESGGRIFASACGIWGGQTGENRIEHNRIRDFYYTGISLGWDWGFADTAARKNLVAYNDISDIGQGMLSDMGGIYVLGKQPFSIILNNRIRNVDARGYGGWGIYLDEGSTGWTVQDNQVVNTKTGGFHIHYGGDNMIRNNVFVGARTDAQLIRTRDNQQGPIRFEKNVLVSLDPAVPIVGPNWLKRDVVMTENAFWSPATGRELPFGADATNQWVDAKLNGQDLPTNTALWKMGIKPLRMDRIGPR
jgi:parallel beta-helix repeat protein